MFNRKGLLWVPSGGGSWIVSASGRSFMRHPTLPGTIMLWDDNGTERQTLVLDAAYRTIAKLYSDYTTNLGLTTHTNTGGIDSSYERKSAENYTDAILNAKTFCTQDTRSSTVATNEWATSSYYGTSMAAAYYVRNTLSTTAGVMTACDLPTIDCLARIWADAVILDSLDPTSSGSDYNLTDWSFGGARLAWSSSWYGGNGVDYYGLYVYRYGDVDFGNQGYRGGVVPVLEIG